MDKVDGGGLRSNSGKARMDLVPPSTLYAIAKVMEFGASKYQPHNWNRGMPWSIPYSCAMRHLTAFMMGEDLDKESGQPHLYHVACNIAMLIEFMHTCPELDDRYKGKQAQPSDFNDTTLKMPDEPNELNVSPISCSSYSKI